MVRQVPLLRRCWQRLVHVVQVLVAATVATLLAFLVLPVMATIGKAPTADLTLQTVDTAAVPPPPPPPEPEPEKEKEPDPPPPDLPDEAPPLDLSQLELALNPGMGGDFLGGDFSIGKFATNAAGGDGDGDGLFSLADLDQKPRPVHQPSPNLTPELRRRAPATVHILFLVGTDGRVENPIVHKSSDPLFDAAALAAIKQWRFEPGKRNGQPVRFRMRVPITFPAG